MMQSLSTAGALQEQPPSIDGCNLMVASGSVKQETLVFQAATLERSGTAEGIKPR
jgi:hypothetical protein